MFWFFGFWGFAREGSGARFLVFSCRFFLFFAISFHSFLVTFSFLVVFLFLLFLRLCLYLSLFPFLSLFSKIVPRCGGRYTWTLFAFSILRGESRLYHLSILRGVF